MTPAIAPRWIMRRPLRPLIALHVLPAVQVPVYTTLGMDGPAGDPVFAAAAFALASIVMLVRGRLMAFAAIVQLLHNPVKEVIAMLGDGAYTVSQAILLGTYALFGLVLVRRHAGRRRPPGPAADRTGGHPHRAGRRRRPRRPVPAVGRSPRGGRMTRVVIPERTHDRPSDPRGGRVTHGAIPEEDE